MIEFYPNISVSEDEREQHLLALYPPYIPPNRIPQPVEPETQQEPPAVEAAPEITAPPVEPAEPVKPEVEPQWNPALANVFALASGPLAGKQIK